jgi:homogentisate 1,2-dioxygenase
MPHYLKRGDVPPKRHTQFRAPDGALRHEELIGTSGFAGIQSLLYHLRPPTRIRRLEQVDSLAVDHEPAGPLRPRHLRGGDIAAGGDAVAGRVPLLDNADLTLSLARPTEPMDYFYRYADGDQVIFVHGGEGRLESQFGELRYRPGDYLVVPAGTLFRLLPQTGSDTRLLVLLARGHVEPPRRHLNRFGQFLEHSPYCERDLRAPERLEAHDEAGEFEVRVEAQGRLTRFVNDHHPLDVVGWDGCLYPYAFNIADFEPITGRLHQPPPVHQTFEGPGFVLCSFVPRLFDYHPQAIPAPYNHSNLDTDEILYYVRGEFMSRKGIASGSLTVHPRGIPHGPHPGTYEGSIGKAGTDELAVMVDTFRPLRLTRQAAAIEDADYAFSWLE